MTPAFVKEMLKRQITSTELYKDIDIDIKLDVKHAHISICHVKRPDTRSFVAIGF